MVPVSGGAPPDEAPATVDRATATIAERAESVRRAETERAVRRLRDRRDLTDEEITVLQGLAARLVGQLVASPAQTLRSADADVAGVAMDLFGED
ncbi:hypothetical protein ACKVMT_02985 [Halobacteriales archaeon Cl-PHB]